MQHLAKKPKAFSDLQERALDEIVRLDDKLAQHFKEKLLVQPELNRSLVSFQANKTRTVYRWYKYKEAKKASLVEYLFKEYKIASDTILEPFADSKTALFVASEIGMNAEEIELLPIGQELIKTRKLLELDLNLDNLETLKRWLLEELWEQSQIKSSLSELRITKGTYPDRTREAIERYTSAWEPENERVRSVLKFALLCILESISYTCKDGQYLRYVL